jgi:hypothetical protein
MSLGITDIFEVINKDINNKHLSNIVISYLKDDTFLLREELKDKTHIIFDRCQYMWIYENYFREIYSQQRSKSRRKLGIINNYPIKGKWGIGLK